MSGFLDSFGSAATQPVQSFTLNNGLQRGNTTAVKAPQPLVGKASGGGLGGFLYNNFVQPTLNTVSEIPGSLYNTADAAVTAAKNPKGGANTQNAIAEEKGLLNQTITGGEQDPNAKPVSLEQGIGNTGNAILNVAAPVVGGEELAGRAGIKALTVGGAKLGAKFGLLGGAANAASQNENGAGIAGGAITGAAEGGALGAAGGAVGATLGKVAGGVANKFSPATADEAGAGASAASGNQKPGGLFPNAAAKAGTKSAEQAMGQASIDFSGDAQKQANAVVGHDKQGNPVGIRSVQSYLRGVGMPDNAAGMGQLSNISQRTIGSDLGDITEGINVDASNARNEGLGSVNQNIGPTSKSGNTASNADSAVRNIRNATEPLNIGANGLNTQSTVKDVLGVRSQLQEHKANSDIAAHQGNVRAAGESKAYQDTIDSLDKTLNSAGVNKAVANHTVSAEGEAKIRQTVAGEGGSPKLAQKIIDAENNAQSYQDLISETQIPTLAGKLSRVARETFESSVPKIDQATGKQVIPSWELAMSLHQPSYLAAGAARLAQNSGIKERVLSGINPGAFNGARDAALAPDAITQEKLDMPGVGGGPLPQEPAPTAPLTSPSTPAPAPTEAAPVTPASTAPAGPAGPVNLSFPATDTTTPVPVNQASNLDSTLQQIGIRRNVPAEPTQVPVTGGNTNGAVPVTIPNRGPVGSSAQQALNSLANGAHAVAGAVNKVDDVVRQSAANAPKTVNAVRNAVGNAQLPRPNASAVLGSLIGQGGNQIGQSPLTAGATAPAARSVSADTGVDENGTPTQWVSAADAGPTLDASTIPGGTLQEFEAEVSANPKNATIYKDIYDSAQAQVKASIPKAPTAAQASGATSIQDAFGYLDTVEQELNALGGVNAQSGYEAKIPLIGKYLQPGVTAYNETKFDAATALAKALTGRAATSASLKLATESLPSPTDSPSQAAQKLANVRLELANKAPDYGLVPATSGQ